MSRLRQKYKKLKKKLENLLNTPVKFTTVQREVLPYKVVRIVPEMFAKDEVIERMDVYTAREIGEALLKSGYIKKEVSDKGDLVIEYILYVVSPEEGDE